MRLAAEKKKQAEDARLAAAEQAKLLAQAKAADIERLAAEKAQAAADKKKQADDAKLALAEQQRQAAATAKPDATKIASAEPPKQDKPEIGKPADPAVASLAPAELAKSAPPLDIPRLLQSELKRVGCQAGEIEGEWNASSRRALASFNDHAGTRLDIKLASLDALDAVRAKTGRVCPLECDRGFRADGDRCAKISCDDDQVLGSNGSCRPRPERAPKVVAHRERAPAPRGGGRCFSFNGKQVCE